jgi:hypothetical protein
MSETTRPFLCGRGMAKPVRKMRRIRLGGALRYRTGCWLCRLPGVVRRAFTRIARRRAVCFSTKPVPCGERALTV